MRQMHLVRSVSQSHVVVSEAHVHQSVCLMDKISNTTMIGTWDASIFKFEAVTQHDVVIAYRHCSDSTKERYWDIGKLVILSETGGFAY